MKEYPANIVAIAELSMKMWQYCRSRGLKAEVKLSHSSEASRYLKIDKTNVFRLSDHPAGDPDCSEAILRWGDDYVRKSREAMLQLEQILDGSIAYAA